MEAREEEEDDEKLTEGKELGRRVDMEQHEGALGELVQRPEQRGPGLSYLPPYRYVHLLGGERRFRRIIGVRRGRRGGAGRGGSHVRVLACRLGIFPGVCRVLPAVSGFGPLTLL